MQNKRGFTIIELLVYMGVSTLVLLSVTAVLFGVLATYSQSRTRHAQTVAFMDIQTILGDLVEEAYDIDPSSSLDTNLAQTGTEITFLHTETNADIRVFLSNQILFAQIGNGQPAALHANTVKINSCIATRIGAAATGLRLTCGTSGSPQFGLPEITTQSSIFLSMQSYAP